MEQNRLTAGIQLLTHTHTHTHTCATMTKASEPSTLVHSLSIIITARSHLLENNLPHLNTHTHTHSQSLIHTHKNELNKKGVTVNRLNSLFKDVWTLQYSVKHLPRPTILNDYYEK